jgi:hypothetical protein
MEDNGFLIFAGPLFAALALTCLKAIAFEKSFSIETSFDVTADMTFLALGSVAAALHWAAEHGETERLVGVMMFELLLAGIVLYARRFANRKKPMGGYIFLNLLISIVSIEVAVVMSQVMGKPQ